MKHFTCSDLAAMDNRYRANLINTLSGFKSVSLIGTSDERGNFNLAIFSNIVHLGADPALIAFINRPREATPHTLGNIEMMGIYTINHITPQMTAQAHQTSAKYGVDVSEFEATGLSSILRDGCPAPFVAESPVQYSLKLVEIIPIKHNRTFMVIGCVQDIYFKEAHAISQDGFLNLSELGSVASLGIDGYYKTSQLARYPYAVPVS
jgi:flavin reductase (DIM6/NTAB) family NADH-FMN oxidoreductase RutF